MLAQVSLAFPGGLSCAGDRTEGRAEGVNPSLHLLLDKAGRASTAWDSVTPEEDSGIREASSECCMHEARQALPLHHTQRAPQSLVNSASVT